MTPCRRSSPRDSSAFLSAATAAVVAAAATVADIVNACRWRPRLDTSTVRGQKAVGVETGKEADEDVAPLTDQ